MDLGLHYWNFSTPEDPARIAKTLAAAARTAEQAGFAELSVMDHVQSRWDRCSTTGCQLVCCPTAIPPTTPSGWQRLFPRLADFG